MFAPFRTDNEASAGCGLNPFVAVLRWVTSLCSVPGLLLKRSIMNNLCNPARPYGLPVLMTIVFFLTTMHRLHGDEKATPIVWDKERSGWQVGARLINSSQTLQPGDPVVIQFLLKNVSPDVRTVVLKQYENSFPTLGAHNRINLNISGGSDRTYQHTILPGNVLQERQYRITVSTEGLIPGKYQVDTQPAFWQTVDGQPNRGRGIGRRVPVDFSLGDPDSIRFTEPPVAVTAEDKIQWGERVAGLVVGMRFPEGRTNYRAGSVIQGEMFVCNVSDRTMEFEYEIPSLTDWNMSVQTADGNHVRLDWVWFSGLRPRNTSTMTLNPGEQRQLTVVQPGNVLSSTPSAGEERPIGPVLQILKEKNDFEYGNPKRLITSGGEYLLTAYLSIRQTNVPDLNIIAGSSPVPFTVD